MDNNLLTIFYDDGESRGIRVGVSRVKGAGLKAVIMDFVLKVGSSVDLSLVLEVVELRKP